MNKYDSISLEFLREILHYDISTGVFTWKVRRGFAQVGMLAGTPDKNGYIAIRINRHSFQSHRLAWFYVRGIWPVGQIDHIDGCKTNNSLDNLRDVTGTENSENLRSATARNLSGVLGVSRNPRGKPWRAQIKVNRKSIFLGMFNTKEEAHEAYLAAKRKLHAGCTL